MKLSAVAAIVVATCAACGGSAPPPAAHASNAHAPVAAAGATMAQPADDPKRPLTADECETLGQWISEGCHGGGSRSAVVDGWCSDVVARAANGMWVADCTAHIHRLDTVCFLGSSSPSNMMSCDATIAR
jgi:hypothetical protein